MAGKYKRTTIGSVIKSKDPLKPNYMQFRLKNKKGEELLPGASLTIRDGDTFSVESKAYSLKSAQRAHADGKISEEVLVQIEERLAKQPEFVLGEIIHVSKND